MLYEHAVSLEIQSSWGDFRWGEIYSGHFDVSQDAMRDQTPPSNIFLHTCFTFCISAHWSSHSAKKINAANLGAFVSTRCGSLLVIGRRFLARIPASGPHTLMQYIRIIYVHNNPTRLGKKSQKFLEKIFGVMFRCDMLRSKNSHTVDYAMSIFKAQKGLTHGKEWELPSCSNERWPLWPCVHWGVSKCWPC